MKLYNHVAFKMGQREALIASYIHEGGNWQDIPLTYSDTRLDKIRETGGRTTYYGRMSWDKPSYTIATYFNRVGNGCNLHLNKIESCQIERRQDFKAFPTILYSKAQMPRNTNKSVTPSRHYWHE